MVFIDRILSNIDVFFGSTQKRHKKSLIFENEKQKGPMNTKQKLKRKNVFYPSPSPLAEFIQHKNTKPFVTQDSLRRTNTDGVPPYVHI